MSSDSNFETFSKLAGALVRVWRFRAGLTQQQVNGISRPTLSKIEKGLGVKDKTLKQVFLELNIPNSYWDTLESVPEDFNPDLDDTVFNPPQISEIQKRDITEQAWFATASIPDSLNRQSMVKIARRSTWAIALTEYGIVIS